MKAELSRAADELRQVIQAHPRLTVLTGAGVSVGSGIPTYRDHDGVWRRNPAITHRDFLGSPRQRQRYWGRSFAGWPPVRDALPGPAHTALAHLEQEGRVELLITQNVDRLHQKAGSRAVVDLHGRLDRVRCLACDRLSTREALQQVLAAKNPGLHTLSAVLRPDGDADLSDSEADTVQVPDCDQCGGMLMPDVVFFGGSIPPGRIDGCMDSLYRSDALLVVGSSLQIFSGYRFCKRAREAGIPVFIVNPGATRADALARRKWALPAEALLPTLVHAPQEVPSA
jgi:NAD-dependent SIR2 family protein deacetylase